MGSGQEYFHLEVEETDGRTTIRLSGEFDTQAAQSFDRAMDSVMMSKPAMVVIDLAEVSFIDSSGLRSLIRAQRVISVTGSLTLQNPRPATVRLLDITGLADEFSVG